MNTSEIGVILLAAGRGSRFGGGKLEAELGGKPVIRHAADRLLKMPFARRILVSSHSTPIVEGFERIALDPPDAPLSRSIATGILALSGAKAALIALADMPLVPASHFRALLDVFDGDRIGTGTASRIMVPAIFGAAHFPALLDLAGDQGAATLLQAAGSIPLDEMLALDVDTRDDLALAEAIIQGR